MSTRILFAAGSAFALILLSSCAPRREAPAPAPPPPQEPAPAPPRPAPPPVAWEDAPLSLGDWTYAESAGNASARFEHEGVAALLLRCEPGGRVALVRTGGTGSELTVRTTYGERRLPAAAGPDGLTARLAAGDALLDEIVFSRGRFAVDAAGLSLLIVPAWPEPARVVEDCRG